VRATLERFGGQSLECAFQQMRRCELSTGIADSHGDPVEQLLEKELARAREGIRPCSSGVRDSRAAALSGSSR